MIAPSPAVIIPSTPIAFVIVPPAVLDPDLPKIPAEVPIVRVLEEWLATPLTP